LLVPARSIFEDSSDEFLLEVAVAGQAGAIVTHNIRHFSGVERSRDWLPIG